MNTKAAKEYYSTYRADDSLSDLSHKVIEQIIIQRPVTVMEFGAGTGKHLDLLHGVDICTIGIDISPMNVYKAIHKYDLPCVICSDETYLRNLCNVDCVFTVSVCDHIENITDIVREFQRIANKAVILAEATRHDPDNYYWNHNYEKLGFEAMNYKWESESDGATYLIWVWKKGQPIKGAIDPELITM